MKAAIYNRVSTTTQGDPAKAMDDLRAAAAQRGYTVTLEVAEQGSGARNDRPGLQRVLEAARKGKVEAVLVQRLDRFGRSAVDLVTNIDAIVAAGARFVAVEQGIDVGGKGDAVSRLILVVMSGVAEFERAIIRDRVVEGQRRARKKGKHLGRRPDEGAPNPDEVRRRREQRESWAQIGEALGCTPSSARRAVLRAA